jgi:hypothetical protein
LEILIVCSTSRLINIFSVHIFHLKHINDIVSLSSTSVDTSLNNLTCSVITN